MRLHGAKRPPWMMPSNSRLDTALKAGGGLPVVMGLSGYNLIQTLAWVKAFVALPDRRPRLVPALTTYAHPACSAAMVQCDCGRLQCL